jgi:pyruvate formate lyase activating enzyme
MKAMCDICFRHCELEEGQLGFCQARKNLEGIVICENYGKVTSIALDPIEKKPLQHFYPGSKILSVGSYGCNLRCPFCQNSDISMVSADETQTKYFSPETLVQKAVETKPLGNIGIAYTYNEPLVGYEFVLDNAKLIKERNLKNVVVTNGSICEKPLRELLRYVDAMNIDLKGFTESFYNKIDGNLETVKQSIMLAAKECHLEITTLIIPNENDSQHEIDNLARWLSSINREIPLHVSRFFPRWKMKDKNATSLKTIHELADTARIHLEYVYEGNC